MNSGPSEAVGRRGLEGVGDESGWVEEPPCYRGQMQPCCQRLALGIVQRRTENFQASARERTPGRGLVETPGMLGSSTFHLPPPALVWTRRRDDSYTALFTPQHKTQSSTIAGKIKVIKYEKSF